MSVSASAPSAVELPRIAPAWSNEGKSAGPIIVGMPPPMAPPAGAAGSPNSAAAGSSNTTGHFARPPATNTMDYVPQWLADEKDHLVQPKADLAAHKPDADAPGIIVIPPGEDLYVALDKRGYMFSMENGSSCCGRIVDNGQLGVVERRGQVKFTKPGQVSQMAIHSTHTGSLLQADLCCLWWYRACGVVHSGTCGTCTRRGPTCPPVVTRSLS
jgi:hypothetical protein